MTPVVVWDDGCSFCARSVRAIRALDWRRRLTFTGSSDRAALARFGITPEEADREVKIVLGARVVGGYDGLVEVARLLPLTAWAVPLLGLAWVRAIGRRVYARVAARRKCGV